MSAPSKSPLFQSRSAHSCASRSWRSAFAKRIWLAVSSSPERSRSARASARSFSASRSVAATAAVSASGASTSIPARPASAWIGVLSNGCFWPVRARSQRAAPVSTRRVVTMPRTRPMFREQREPTWHDHSPEPRAAVYAAGPAHRCIASTIVGLVCPLPALVRPDGIATGSCRGTPLVDCALRCLSVVGPPLTQPWQREVPGEPATPEPDGLISVGRSHSNGVPGHNVVAPRRKRGLIRTPPRRRRRTNSPSSSDAVAAARTVRSSRCSSTSTTPVRLLQIGTDVLAHSILCRLIGSMPTCLLTPGVQVLLIWGS